MHQSNPKQNTEAQIFQFFQFHSPTLKLNIEGHTKVTCPLLKIGIASVGHTKVRYKKKIIYCFIWNFYFSFTVNVLGKIQLVFFIYC